MVCHRSGKDHLKALQRSPAADPKPEPKYIPPVDPKPRPLTRKEKRSLKGDYRLRESTLSPDDRTFLRQHGVDL
jgi:hypothetical protein